MTKFFYLAVGSLVGGFARFFLAELVGKNFGSSFPYGTLSVNLLGCFLIGFFSVMVEDKFFLGPHGRIFLMTGFCGAFTTFSALMFETDTLAKGGELNLAFLNVLLSLVVGFIVFRLGIRAGEFFN